jgi:tetratricopeptide (TPR) repeat protein
LTLKGVAPVVAAKRSGGLCFGINREGFSRSPAQTDVNRKEISHIQRVEKDPTNVPVSVTRQTAAPRLDGIDRFQPIGEPEILDLLHNQSRVSAVTMRENADSLMTQALQARRENRLDDAHRCLVDAVHLCRNTGIPVDLARALTALGQIERDMDHTETALTYYQEAADIYGAEGDLMRLAHTIRHVADIHQDAGRMLKAEPLYQEALRLYRNDGRTGPLDLANTIRGLAISKEHAGQFEQAKILWAEAKTLYMGVNVRQGVAESSRRLASLDSQPVQARS